MQITVLRRWCDLSKTISFFKRHFLNYRPKSFSKFFSLGYRFFGLWYTLGLYFMEYWTEVMTDIVFNRLGNVMQFLSWYCANTSLVIAEIYDAFKRISEYFQYFESFQFNCYLLEKGYLQFLKKFFQRILNFWLNIVCKKDGRYLVEKDSLSNKIYICESTFSVFFLHLNQIRQKKSRNVIIVALNMNSFLNKFDQLKLLCNNTIDLLLVLTETKLFFFLPVSYWRLLNTTTRRQKWQWRWCLVLI